jgi:arylsulfatase A-like enzyme
MKLLHMITASPARTPSFTMFGDPDYFFFNSGSANCALPPACVVEDPGFAWNHGDVQEDITRTWMAMAGPGVRHEGRNDSVFSDHTDVRPTMLALLGLKDSYIHDGRVLAEKIDEHALPHSLRDRGQKFIELATLYKQLNAPLGSVGRDSLVFANRSITSDDVTYAQYLATLGAITADRDALATQIKSALNAAAFANQPVDEHQEDGLADRARRIIDQVEDLAGTSRDHDDHGDHGDHGNHGG